MGDADRIQQIIWNLLSNAVKFTETRRPGDASGITRDADVADAVRQGHRPRHLAGVPAADVRAVPAGGLVVEPAARRPRSRPVARPTTRRAARRAGERHERREATAARFTVTFPARTELTAGELEFVADLVPSELLAGKRVMLVEDQADAREIINAALQHYGVSVTNAASSREALAALDTAVAARLPPDVIISDIGLPEEDGYRSDGADLRAPEVPGRRDPGDRGHRLRPSAGQAARAGGRIPAPPDETGDARRARFRRGQCLARWTHDSGDRRAVTHQISPTVKPSGNGSCGSTTYCAKPVIQAVPASSGTTARYGPTVRFFQQRAGEHRAEHAFVAERLSERQGAARVQRRHLRAGAGAAGRAIDRAGPGRRTVPVELSRRDDDGVAAVIVRRRPPGPRAARS